MVAIWLAARLRPALMDASGAISRARERMQDRGASALEADHLRATFRRAQAMHLAGALFPLDEILVEPALLAPPPSVEPGGLLAHEDAVTMTVPFTPAWPELGALYRAPTLTLTEALSGGCNLAIIGQPGSGKTVALAHLASLLANRDPGLGALKDFVPLLIHVAELELPATTVRDAVNRLAEMIAEETATVSVRKAAKLVHASLNDGRAVLMLDGFDELTAPGQREVTAWLGLVRASYPGARIVVTGAPEYLDGLMALGFVPIPIVPWHPQQREDFVARWFASWRSLDGHDPSAKQPDDEPDTLLATSWLDNDGGAVSPLEFTLQLWSAAAQDGYAHRTLDALSAHIRRLVPRDTPDEALEALAVQVMLTAQPLFEPSKARGWVREFELPEELDEMDSEAAEDESVPESNSHPAQRRTRPAALKASTPGLLGRLATSGLLAPHSQGKMSFVHPVLCGYLAGRGLGGYKAGETLVNQPDWIGKLLAMRYFAAHGDVQSLVTLMLGWSRLPMHRPLLTAARWLRDAPSDVPWRDEVLAALARVMQTPGLPMSLRSEALAALIASGDASVASLFRRMLNTSSDELSQLSALGSGALRDEKALGPLEELLLSRSPATRRAACLALVAIGTTGALETVGQALLRGDEDLQRAAAEALANDRGEGQAVLEEGADHPNILVRRAVVYGLARTPTSWASDRLERLRLEDEQWVVRNAAGEALESRQPDSNARIPRPLAPPSEASWLIAFAGRQGSGISPGSRPADVLLAALKSNNPEERLAALEYLRHDPTEGAVRAIYGLMFGNDAELREAAFLALWELGASGHKLPDPSQYGCN